MTEGGLQGMTQNPQQVIGWLMDNARNISRERITSLAEFKTLLDEKTRPFSLPMDRAVAGGFLADRIGYAFAAGYEAALRRLAPDLPEGPIVSLCITEKEGAHPRAIKARLDKRPLGRLYPYGGEELHHRRTRGRAPDGRGVHRDR